MSQVVDFEKYKERFKLRKRSRLVYRNDLIQQEDSDIVLSSITVAASKDEVTVSLNQLDLGQDPPTFDTLSFNPEEIPLLIEALIEVDQCISKEEDH
jgi:hypothetical protein